MKRQKVRKKFYNYIICKVLVSQKSRWLFKMEKDKTNNSATVTKSRGPKISIKYSQNMSGKSFENMKRYLISIIVREVIFLYPSENGKILSLRVHSKAIKHSSTLTWRGVYWLPTYGGQSGSPYQNTCIYFYIYIFKNLYIDIQMQIYKL